MKNIYAAVVKTGQFFNHVERIPEAYEVSPYHRFRTIGAIHGTAALGFETHLTAVFEIKCIVYQ